MRIPLWEHQKECYNNIVEHLKDHDNGIVKMFCGTGKSRIALETALFYCKNLVIFVFPTIALTEQFTFEYLDNCHEEKLSVCSQKDNVSEATIEFTTNKDTVSTFLTIKDKKLVSVTYASLPMLFEIVKEQEISIDLMIFDEAHHIVGNKVQECIQDKTFNQLVQKTLYFTATPQNLYDICGKVIYEFSHYQAVQTDICNDFDICIDVFTPQDPATQRYLNQVLDNEPTEDDKKVYKEERKGLLYDALARTILQTKNTKALSFHYQSETEHDTKTHVDDFVNIGDFKRHFNNVRSLEFPEYQPPQITMKKVVATTRNRSKILADFDSLPDSHVVVLSSCRAIGEGIDTKRGNLVMFADAKTSPIAIIQNIGRATRKNEYTKRKSTILIPCYTNLELYRKCKNQEERSQVLVNEICKDGNFEPILNVLTALKQDDPAYYELCMRYPCKYSPTEVKENLEKHGCKIGKTYTRKELADYYEIKDSDVLFEQIADILECKIEVYTQSMEEPVVIYNDGKDSFIRFFYNEDDETYNYIKGKKKIQQPNRKRFRLNINACEEFKVLWDFTNDSLETIMNKAVTTAYIQSTIKVVKDKGAMTTAIKFVNWVKENGRFPQKRSKDEEERKLGIWLNNQRQGSRKKNCNTPVKVYLDENLPGWLNSKEQQAMEQAVRVVKWKRERGEFPNKYSKNKEEKFLGKWLSAQKMALKGKGTYTTYPSVINYLNTECPEWTDTLEKISMDRAIEFVEWVNEHGKFPSSTSKDAIERKMGTWLCGQKQSLKDNSTAVCYPSVQKYLNDNTPDWSLSLEEKTMKIAIQLVEFFTKHRRLPKINSIDVDESSLARWVGYQKQALKGNVGVSYPSVVSYLDTEIPGWSDDSILKIAMKKTVFLVEWVNKHKRLPDITSKDASEHQAGQWLYALKQTFRNRGLNSKIKTYLDENLPGWNHDRRESTRTIQQQTSQSEKQRQKVIPLISQLHKQYKTMHSETFKDKMDSKHFIEYHQLAKKLDITDEVDQQVPNVLVFLIKHTLNISNILKLEKQKIIDLGCGTFNFPSALYKKFKTDRNRDKLQNIIVENYLGIDIVDARKHDLIDDLITKELKFIPANIANLEGIDDSSFDIAILSRALWATNKKDVLKEARRVVKHGGRLIVCEPFKRWWKDNTNTLISLLEKNKWIVDDTINTELDENDKHNIFCYVICRKDDYKK